MKTLATCTPREFLKQTNRIRISADKWLTATKILEIRSRMPDVPKGLKPESEEDVKKSLEERRLAFSNQVRENLFNILEAMLDTNADDTLELLALMCFIEPDEVDEHTMSEYFTCIGELIEDDGVQSFFGSLVKLGARSTASAVIL